MTALPSTTGGSAVMRRIRATVGARGSGVVLVALAGAAFGAAVLSVAAPGRDQGTTATWFSAAVGTSYLVAGVIAHLCRPGRVGALMVAVGIAWFAEDLQVAIEPVAHTAGMFLRSVASGVLVHLLVAFPAGRLTSRTERVLVGATYGIAVGLVGLGVPFYVTLTPNLLFVADLSRTQDAVLDVAQIVVAVTVLGILVRRWLRATPPARRVLVPVYAVGLLGAVASATRPALPTGPALVVNEIAHLATLALPIAFLAGLLRVRLGRTAVADLLLQLPRTPAGQLRDLLRRALGDPSLEIVRLGPDGAGLLDRPAVSTPSEITEVRRGSRLVGYLVHDPALRSDPHVLHAVTSAAALALDNQLLADEVAVRLSEVRASRARVVAAADEGRRRIERDLHDGAQQQLVTVALVLRLAREQLAADPVGAGDVDALLERVADGLDAALLELRELARGIHPAVLTEAGLLPALTALASRSVLPVDIVGPGGAEELPAMSKQVAATAYFVVAEAVTNAAKHAMAGRVHVHVRRAGNDLLVTVVDDGVGGADPAKGSGLDGLRDRVAAVDGELTVRSAPAAGTSVHARIPLESP